MTTSTRRSQEEVDRWDRLGDRLVAVGCPVVALFLFVAEAAWWGGRATTYAACVTLIGVPIARRIQRDQKRTGGAE